MPERHEERIRLLSATPLLGTLLPEEIRDVAGAFEERVYRKGDIVCREGEEGHTFYVVAAGELEVWGGGAGSRLLNRLGEGEVFGEMSLLFEGKRSATVRVARQSRLLEIDRDAFNRHLAANPRVLHYFSTLLSQRLAAAARGEVARRSTTVISVSSAPGLEGKSLVASNLAALIRKYTDEDVLLVRTQTLVARDRRQKAPLALSQLEKTPLDRITGEIRASAHQPAILPVAVGESDESESHVRNLGSLAGRLRESFPHIVIDLSARPRSLVRCAREFSDVSVEIVDHCEPGGGDRGDAHTRVYQVMNLRNRQSMPIPINHCEPFVLPDDAELPATIGPDQIKYLEQNLRAPASPPLRRLARKILGRTLGMAVGGGAAFGIAHVGVLKVLEENDIHVDLVAGTSMGSIVAMGYAAGISPVEMLEIAGRIGTKLTTLSALDFTLTKPGLLAGNRLVQIFAPLLGNVKRFDQLRFPCRTVAADIESGERVEIGTGSVTHAFRASCSVPMLWTPVFHEDRVVVDGGMVDPVPAEVVSAMGGDLCIAVNVVPPLKRGVENVLARTWRRVNLANPLAYLGGRRRMPTTFDVIMNTIQMLQHELGNFKAISADVRIVPDLSEFTWVEFYRPLELIERGALAAEQALPEIKRVLAERAATGRAATS